MVGTSQAGRPGAVRSSNARLGSDLPDRKSRLREGINGHEEQEWQRRNRVEANVHRRHQPERRLERRNDRSTFERFGKSDEATQEEQAGEPVVVNPHRRKEHERAKRDSSQGSRAILRLDFAQHHQPARIPEGGNAHEDVEKKRRSDRRLGNNIGRGTSTRSRRADAGQIQQRICRELRHPP